MAKEADLQRPLQGGSRLDEVCWLKRSAVDNLSRPILCDLRRWMISHCFRNARTPVLLLGFTVREWWATGLGSGPCTARPGVIGESLSGREALDGRANLRGGGPD
jgi:hypothetical protein